MIDRAFEQLNLDWRFMTFEIHLDRLAEVFAGVDALGFRGAMLSPSLREMAVGLWGNLTPAAERSHSINSFVRLGDTLTGDNTRVGALRQAVGDFAGRRVVVLGVGGDARTLVSAVLVDSPACVTIASRHESSLRELASQLGDIPAAELLTLLPLTTGDFAVPEATDILIVATSDGEASVDANSLPSALTLVDTTLDSSRTQLVKAAATRRLHIVDGATLMANEVALAVERWTGQSLDRPALRDAVEEFLGI